MTTRCPRCFSRMDLDSCVYQCPGPCEERPDAVASAFQGQPVSQFPMIKLSADGARHWQAPPTVACAKCGKPSTEVCPVCHFRLPKEWRKGNAVCIGLAGAATTGKSVFIGVAIKQLEQMLLQMNARLSYAPGPSADIYHQVYEAALYAARRAIPSTTRVTDTREAVPYQSQPLIISLGLIGGTQRYLVFRDTAGEDLENPGPDTTYLSYLQRADGVFFLFDPTAVPQIRDMLRGLIPDPVRLPGDPEKVLNNVLAIIGNETPPIAMIVSKFDTLQLLDQHEDPVWRAIMGHAGAAFQRDPGIYTPIYREADGQLLHLEIQSLLVTLRAQGFVNAMVNPPRGRPFDHRYFAVSALGGAPEGDKVHPHGISPFRCLDPIRWVLSRQNLLITTERPQRR